MSANTKNLSHHCPALEAIVSHAIEHATDRELCANENYVELKKQLKRQTLLCAEYR
jgi:hypothetical protein